MVDLTEKSVYNLIYEKHIFMCERSLQGGQNQWQEK